MNSSTNNISDSILGNSPSSITSAQPSSSTNSLFSSTNVSSDESNFFSFFKQINATTWIIIILLLAFLGFNIFTFLGKTTNEINSILAPFLKKITDISLYLSSQIVGVTAAGTKNIVQGTSNVVESGLTDIENVADKISDKNKGNISSTTPSSLSTTNVPPKAKTVPPIDNNSINKALNTAQNQTQSLDYEADDATSNIQSGSSKSGWCYIGEDRGFRSCIEVNKSDNCMSGDIFPSQQICVNPNLRN